jgi:hypothetical protein
MLVAVVVTILEAIVVARRRGYLIGADTVVRCRSGHLFTTMWIPGGSLKAVRLGWWRFQRCPVEKHWSLVTPVVASELTEDERRVAAQIHDVRIP